MVPYWELIQFLPPSLSLLWRGTECQKFYNRCEALGKYLQRFPMERLRLWFGRETLELLRTMLAACGEEKPWALLVWKRTGNKRYYCKWTELCNGWPHFYACMTHVFLSMCECLLVSTLWMLESEKVGRVSEVLAVMSWNVKGSVHEY